MTLQSQIPTMWKKRSAKKSRKYTELATANRIVNLHAKQVTSLRDFFHQKQQTSGMYRAVVLVDQNQTPFNVWNDGSHNTRNMNDRQRDCRHEPERNLMGGIITTLTGIC